MPTWETPERRILNALKRVRKDTIDQYTDESLTIEPIQAVKANRHVVVGGVDIPTTGTYQARAGEPAAVVRKGGLPVVALKHNARRAQFAVVEVQAAIGIVEELFVAINDETGLPDVFFRNHDQKEVPLDAFSQITGLSFSLAGFRHASNIGWGVQPDCFWLLRYTAAGFNLIYHVFELGTRSSDDVFHKRNPNKIMPTGARMAANLVATYDLSTDGMVVHAPIEYTFDSLPFQIPPLNTAFAPVVLSAPTITVGVGSIGSGGMFGRHFPLRTVVDEDFNLIISMGWQIGGPPGVALGGVTLVSVWETTIINVTTHEVLFSTLDTLAPPVSLYRAQNRDAYPLDVSHGELRVYFLAEGWFGYAVTISIDAVSGGFGPYAGQSFIYPKFVQNMVHKGVPSVAVAPEVVYSPPAPAPFTGVIPEIKFNEGTPPDAPSVTVELFNRHRTIMLIQIGFTTEYLVMVPYDAIDHGAYQVLEFGTVTLIGTTRALFEPPRMRLLNPDFLYDIVTLNSEFFIRGWNQTNGTVTLSQTTANFPPRDTTLVPVQKLAKQTLAVLLGDNSVPLKCFIAVNDRDMLGPLGRYKRS